MSDRHDLTSEYTKIELKRERRLYSLKRNNVVKAILMLNISDFAINMSDLTNCISVFVIDPDNTESEIIYSAISQLSEKFKEKKFPVLLYPLSYAEGHSFKYEKTYNLWTLDMQHTDDYFKNFNYLV